MPRLKLRPGARPAPSQLEHRLHVLAEERRLQRHFARGVLVDQRRARKCNAVWRRGRGACAGRCRLFPGAPCTSRSPAAVTHVVRAGVDAHDSVFLDGFHLHFMEKAPPSGCTERRAECRWEITGPAAPRSFRRAPRRAGSGDDRALTVDQEVRRNALDGVILGGLVVEAFTSLTCSQFMSFCSTAPSQSPRSSVDDASDLETPSCGHRRRSSGGELRPCRDRTTKPRSRAGHICSVPDHRFERYLLACSRQLGCAMSMNGWPMSVLIICSAFSLSRTGASGLLHLGRNLAISSSSSCPSS